jgi:magnesium transporter
LTVHARLFDADGTDRDFDLETNELPPVGDRRLVWIDLDERTERDLQTLADRLDLTPALVRRLATVEERPRLTQYPDHIHLSLGVMDAPEAAEGATDPEPRVSADVDLERVELDVVAGRDWVVTVHDGPMPAIDRILDDVEGESRLGALDAGGFLAAIVESVIVGYFHVVEGLERDIDHLDEAALRRRPREDILAAIVRMRRRVGQVRRAIAPHREAFAMLTRPDMELHEELGRPWPGLLDRLEAAVDAVEQLREALLGTYDIYMGRAGQRDSDVMKTLTILSAVLLPSVVLAGVMGMNFKLGFFDDPSNFLVVIGAMGLLAVVILGAAKLRGWL